jgi:methylated-DNA-[protein]-cysteine S-methyltransferase
MKSEIRCTKLLDTPVGTLAILANDFALVALEFVPKGASRLEFTSSTQAQSHAEKAVEWLSEYFSGSKDGPAVALELQGTDFQKSVWAQITSIGYGKTLTYGQIAARIGKPKASRAVGAAVGANPIPLIVPCHRVMGSSGKITGYSGGDGIPTKMKLLELERIAYVR